MGNEDLKEEVIEAFLIALDEGKRGDKRKAKKRFQKQVARNTITSDDGDHKIIGTQHYDPKDHGRVKKDKKNYAHQTRKEVGSHLKKLRKAGKEVDFGVEGGSHESPNKGFERDIALGTTKGKKGVNLQSNELGDWSKHRRKGDKEPFMKNDADRTEADFRRNFPRDYGDRENPESKYMDRINRLRQKGFGRFAKTAQAKKRGSIQLVGAGHTKPDTATGHKGTPGVRRKGFGEQFKNAVLNYLDEGASSGENPMMTGGRVGNFMAKLKRGEVKRGRRGAGSVGDPKRMRVVTHLGKDKTDKDYYDQIKRIKKKTANTSTRYGDTKDHIETGMQFQKHKDAFAAEGDNPDLDTVAKHINRDRALRRASKDVSRKLFDKSMKMVHDGVLKGPKKGERPGFGAK